MKQPRKFGAVSHLQSITDYSCVRPGDFIPITAERTELSRDHRAIFSPVQTGYIISGTDTKPMGSSNRIT